MVLKKAIIRVGALASLALLGTLHEPEPVEKPSFQKTLINGRIHYTGLFSNRQELLDLVKLTGYYSSQQTHELFTQSFIKQGDFDKDGDIDMIIYHHNNYFHCINLEKELEFETKIKTYEKDNIPYKIIRKPLYEIESPYKIL